MPFPDLTHAPRCYDAWMRTTVDLPADIHELARELAHQQNRTMSEVVTELIRMGLSPAGSVQASAKGMPTISVGRKVTAEDVRSLEDEG